MSALFYFGFQEFWEQDGNVWRYLQRKILNIISVKRFIFCKSEYFAAEMGRASSKGWMKKGTYYTTKTLSCNTWMAMWFVSAPKMTKQAKNLFWVLLGEKVESSECKNLIQRLLCAICQFFDAQVRIRWFRALLYLSILWWNRETLKQSQSSQDFFVHWALDEDFLKSASIQQDTKNTDQLERDLSWGNKEFQEMGGV